MEKGELIVENWRIENYDYHKYYGHIIEYYLYAANHNSPFSTIHSQLSILNYPFSTIHSQLSILNYPFSIVN